MRTERTKLVIAIKRAYEPPSPQDGYRVLVDRLWPRGLSRAEASIDAWVKDLAPSSELRRWFAGGPGRWEEFAQRYRLELAAPAIAARLAELASKASSGMVTLLYAKRNVQENNAIVLRDVLQDFASRL